MNKNIIKSTFVAVLALTFFSFTNLFVKEVNVKDSKITWKGYKVTGDHKGTINLTSGTLMFEGDKLTGGKFTVDMSSITVTDLSGDSKGKLEGHLKSDDFFGVETYPTANFVITGVKGTAGKYVVTGDLTIKNKTNPLTFEMTVANNQANATLKIDRSKFDVRYGSPSFFNDLKDKAIYDEFDMNVTLMF